MKWDAHRDWGGFHIGWFPTAGDDRQLSLQHIRWHCWNLDFGWSLRHDYRIQWQQRGYFEHLHGPKNPNRGLRRLRFIRPAHD